MSVDVDIAHDPIARRLEARVEGEHCTLDYELDGNVMTITHVIVPEPVGNRGIAAALTEAAFAYAREHGLRVVPRCPYAAAWVARHRQWADLVAR
jgi:predicted GNAT family acetyltransferase